MVVESFQRFLGAQDRGNLLLVDSSDGQGLLLAVLAAAGHLDVDPGDGHNALHAVDGCDLRDGRRWILIRGQLSYGDVDGGVVADVGLQGGGETGQATGHRGRYRHRDEQGRGGCRRAAGVAGQVAGG